MFPLFSRRVDAFSGDVQVSNPFKNEAAAGYAIDNLEAPEATKNWLLQLYRSRELKWHDVDDRVVDWARRELPGGVRGTVLALLHANILRGRWKKDSGTVDIELLQARYASSVQRLMSG